MKVALGIIARPVESLLVLCLRPVIAHFDGLVMLTSRKPDWTDDVASLVHGSRQFTLRSDYTWKHDYGDARNTLIGHAEGLGYDWLMFLDADESMLPDDLGVMRRYMETEESLIFPRYEFVDDFENFCPSFYPDYQVRAFRLKLGYHYAGKVHEALYRGKDGPASEMPYSTLLPMIHLYHYAKCKQSSDVWIKYDTYNQLANGKAPRTFVPADVQLPQSWALDKKKVRFLGSKPL